MKSQYSRGTTVKITNWVIRKLSELGVLPPRFQTLIVTGRKSGRAIETPVSIVENSSSKWIVAPYGVVNWVYNVRATPAVRIRTSKGTHTYITQEVSALESAPVIKEYLSIEKHPKEYFKVTEYSSLEEIQAEAHRYPVFRLDPVDEIT